MDVNAARVLNDTIEDKPASAGIDISHIHEHLQTGNKIKAIKLYREQTGAGLKEAKNAVEAIERGEMPLTETNSHGAKSKPTAADLPDFNKNDKTHVPKITQEYLTIILVESSTLGSAGPGGDSFQKAIQNMNNRDDATAIRCFEEALIKGLDPLRQGYVHANLGEMYIKTNVIEKALDEFKKVLNFKEALYESVHTAVQYLSILYRELGQPEVINVLEQLKYKTSSKINTSLSPETVERVRQLAIKNKSHLLERNAASSTPIDEGKSRKSISNNKEINKLEAKAQYYIDRKKDGKFDEVIADLAPIISKLPDKSDIRKILSSTYLDRGAANYQQGYDNKALADFEEATKVDQENWKALVNLSSLYMASYRWKEALKPLKSIMN
ncbi:MAG: ribosomal protein L7/L12 [Proteobacteria bacterium]|nr:ribosomal protein L7/L12 [Pseudomonadota bacterium]